MIYPGHKENILRNSRRFELKMRIPRCEGEFFALPLGAACVPLLTDVYPSIIRLMFRKRLRLSVDSASAPSSIFFISLTVTKLYHFANCSKNHLVVTAKLLSGSLPMSALMASHVVFEKTFSA